jgi:hypothetical protein
MIYLLRLGVDVDDIAVERSDAMGQQTTEDGLHKIDDSTKKIEATPVSAIWPQCLWPVSGGVLKSWVESAGNPASILSIGEMVLARRQNGSGSTPEP